MTRREREEREKRELEERERLAAEARALAAKRRGRKIGLALLVSGIALFLAALALMLLPPEQGTPAPENVPPPENVALAEPALLHLFPMRIQLVDGGSASVDISVESDCIIPMDSYGAALKDAAIMLFAGKNSGECASLRGGQMIRAELAGRFNGVLGRECVRGVYFGDYIIRP